MRLKGIVNLPLKPRRSNCEYTTAHVITLVIRAFGINMPPKCLWGKFNFDAQNAFCASHRVKERHLKVSAPRARANQIKKVAIENPFFLILLLTVAFFHSSYCCRVYFPWAAPHILLSSWLCCGLCLADYGRPPMWYAAPEILFTYKFKLIILPHNNLRSIISNRYTRWH